jgi:hypothetical protein
LEGEKEKRLIHEWLRRSEEAKPGGMATGEGIVIDPNRVGQHILATAYVQYGISLLRGFSI